jgi:hypothetical protein
MISKEHFVEYFWNLTCRRDLINQEQLERFRRVRGRYAEICNLFMQGAQDLHVSQDGYEWSQWTEKIRKSFTSGVPLDFLSHPTLVKTMVLARRGGIKATAALIEPVLNIFGEQRSRELLKEDYIGLPTIQNLSYMTSANRSRLVNHLAHYTRECKRFIWDSASIVEWGGGYGNMARMIRKMNPSITYIIIDLPELLALQYVYLASIEGEKNIHLITPQNGSQVVYGKVNLISSHTVLSKIDTIQSDAFISTWAITESPQIAQDYVVNHEFFGAKSLLLGFKVDGHNYLRNRLTDKDLRRVPVPLSQRLGDSNEYWFR